MRMRHRLHLVTAALLLFTVTPAVTSAAAAPVSADAARATGLVRVDQLGYAPSERKQGYLMTTATLSGPAFAVTDSAGRVVLTGRAGRSTGAWNTRSAPSTRWTSAACTAAACTGSWCRA